MAGLRVSPNRWFRMHVRPIWQGSRYHHVLDLVDLLCLISDAEGHEAKPQCLRFQQGLMGRFERQRHRHGWFGLVRITYFAVDHSGRAWASAVVRAVHEKQVKPQSLS
jgi:hypothetical protein